MDKLLAIKERDDLIKKFDKIIFSLQYDVNTKIEIFSFMMKEYETECYELLYKIRDVLSYLKGYDLDEMILFLYKLTLTNNINTHERIIISTGLYNRGYIEYCYDCFKSISLETATETKYKIEAAKFLFSSNNDVYREIAQNIIIETINHSNLDSARKYEIITEFHSRKGIKTFLNKMRLRVPYDEEFVYDIHKIFFNNKENGIRERLLSGQYLLQMSLPTEEVKESIEDYFLQISENKDEYDENTRADAADIILRMSKRDQIKIKAREIIGKIGRENPASDKLMDRAETIYTNSQNVHDFTEQVNELLEYLVEENISALSKKYKNIFPKIVEYSKLYISDRMTRYKILKSLKRIEIDTSTFTKYNSTLSEIFILLWYKIENFSEDISNQLKMRLLEELVDMGDTCTSGHIARFINVLSGYDEMYHLKISWEDQIISNVVGRMHAAIKNCPDEDLKYSLTIAKTELADEEDNEKYADFLNTKSEELRGELYEEFVVAGHVKKDDFVKYFDMGISKLI